MTVIFEYIVLCIRGRTSLRDYCRWKHCTIYTNGNSVLFTGRGISFRRPDKPKLTVILGVGHYTVAKITFQILRPKRYGFMWVNVGKNTSDPLVHTTLCVASQRSSRSGHGKQKYKHVLVFSFDLSTRSFLLSSLFSLFFFLLYSAFSGLFVLASHIRVKYGRASNEATSKGLFRGEIFDIVSQFGSF